MTMLSLCVRESAHAMTCMHMPRERALGRERKVSATINRGQLLGMHVCTINRQHNDNHGPTFLTLVFFPVFRNFRSCEILELQKKIDCGHFFFPLNVPGYPCWYGVPRSADNFSFPFHCYITKKSLDFWNSFDFPQGKQF